MSTTVFNCGAECGIVGAGAGGGTATPHWDAVGGTAPTVSTAIARNGGSAYRFNTTGAQSYLRKDTVAAPTASVMRGYFYLASLPNIDTSLMSQITAAGGSARLLYRAATQDVIACVSTTTTGATAVAVTTGVWYRVDMKCDTADSRTCTTSIDGGSNQTATKTAQTASTASSVRIGAGCNSELVTADVYWDDFVYSATTGDYPLGAGQCIGIFPTADGTHSYNAAADFQFDGTTNIGLGATTTWDSINHQMGSISTFLAASGPAAGEYLEWQMDDMGGVTSISGVEVVSAHHAATTSADLQTLRIVDGGTVADVFTDIDFSQTTLVYSSKHYAVAPSTSTAWTKTLVDGLKFRWGSSWTTADISPVPYIDGLILEVDYVPTTDCTGSGAPTATLTATGTGAGTEKLNGSGAPTATLTATGTGAGTEKFNGTGAATATISAAGGGAGIEKYNGSGTPTATLSATGAGVGVSSQEQHFGTGAPTVTLVVTAVGVGTRTPDPDSRVFAVGGRHTFVRTADAPPPKKKRPVPPAPPVPVAADLPDLPENPSWAGRALDPAMFSMVTRPTRTRGFTPAEVPYQPTEGEMEDAFLASLAPENQMNLEAHPDDDEGTRMMKHFLRKLGKGL